MAGTIPEVRCEICGELLDLSDEVHLGHGAFAEMHDPENPEEHGGIVHAECGLARGWQLS